MFGLKYENVGFIYVTVNLYDQVICILSEILWQSVKYKLAIDVLPEYFR